MVEDELRKEIKRLEKLTGIKLPECECHCGVNKFMPLWFRKILSSRFNLSCIIHDIHHGSNIVSNKEADLIFYKNIKRQAGSNLYWRVNSFIYFTFVSMYTKYKNLRDR